MSQVYSDPATVESSICCVDANASQAEQVPHHGCHDVQDVGIESMQYWASTSFQPVHMLPQPSPTSMGFQYGGLIHQDPSVSGSQYINMPNDLTHFHELQPAAFVEPIFSDPWVGDATSYTSSGNDNNLFSHDLPHGYETAATSNLLTNRTLDESAVVDGKHPSSSCAQML